MVDYSVITATYNEASNIEDLARAISEVLRPTRKSFEIIVVDDNSPDGTATIVEKLATAIPELRLLTRINERGIGSAYLHGIQNSSGNIIITMDADFSHPPQELPVLFAAAEDGSLVLGSRFLRRGDFDTLWYRALPTRSINLWHSILLRTGLRDHTNGFLGASRDTLKLILDEGETLGVRPFDRILYGLVLVALAKRMKIRVKELPAKYVFRTRGETKIRFLRGIGLLVEEWLDSLELLPFRYGSKSS